VSSFNDNSDNGYKVNKNVNTTETSQVVIILGLTGLILKYPFNNLLIKTDSLIQRTPKMVKFEKV
jgi:hypothetical protein